MEKDNGAIKKLISLSKTTSCIIAAFLFSKISAGIINVPGDYSRIQIAVIAAKKGDTVLVARGRYYENINFKGKEITLASNYILTKDTADITNTIIDGSKPTFLDSASCIMMVSNEMAGGAVEGFTITRGGSTLYGYSNNNGSYFEGGGIILAKSTATIKHNVIINNNSKDGGGGIALIYGNPTVVNNVIINNKAGYGCGITVNISGGKIYNNIICHNYGGEHDNGGGIMIWQRGSYPVVIQNNTIVGNSTKRSGGGIFDGSDNNASIKNNIIWGNRADLGTHVLGTITYSDIEAKLPGDGNLQLYPNLKTTTLTLDENSPCIDAGYLTDEYHDIIVSGTDNALFPSSGTKKTDMGAFGGPYAEVMNVIELEDLFVPNYSYGIMKLGSSKLLKYEIINRGNTDVTIDSLIAVSKNFNLVTNLKGKKLRQFVSDSLEIECKPTISGESNDTLYIYTSFKKNKKPIKVVLSVKAYDIKEPIINVEHNVSVKLSSGWIRIDGTKCSDANNIPLTFLWKVIANPVEDNSPILMNNTISRPTFYFNYYGTYKLSLTVSNGFYSKTDTVTINVINNVSVSELSNSDGLDIFPNPVSDILYVNLKDNTGLGKLEIIDVNGQKVYTCNVSAKENININLNSLGFSKGLYFVRYNSAEKQCIKKFIYSK